MQSMLLQLGQYLDLDIDLHKALSLNTLFHQSHRLLQRLLILQPEIVVTEVAAQLLFQDAAQLQQRFPDVHQLADDPRLLLLARHDNLGLWQHLSVGNVKAEAHRVPHEVIGGIHNVNKDGLKGQNQAICSSLAVICYES